MERLTKYVIQYLKYVLPVFIFTVGYSLAGYPESRWYWDVLGILSILWLAALLYLIFALTFQVQLRDQFYRKILRINENDEREMIITGNTAKKAFIAMTSFLVLMLFLSTFQIYISKPVIENNVKVKEGRLELGLGFPLTPKDYKPEEVHSNTVINYKGLPLSSGATVLLILLFQVGIFYYFSRKENYDIQN